MFLIIEGIRRKPVKPEVKAFTLRIGLALLLLLFIFATYSDLTRIFLRKMYKAQMGWSGLRRRTRKVMVGKVQIGGDSPISVQSMTNTDTTEYEATLHQVRRLKDAGLRHEYVLRVPSVEV